MLPVCSCINVCVYVCVCVCNYIAGKLLARFLVFRKYRLHTLTQIQNNNYKNKTRRPATLFWIFENYFNPSSKTPRSNIIYVMIPLFSIHSHNLFTHISTIQELYILQNWKTLNKLRINNTDTKL